MDFKKGLIILSLLLILCVSLGAVSATDNIDINDGNQEDLVVSTVNVDGNNNDNGGDSDGDNGDPYTGYWEGIKDNNLGKWLTGDNILYAELHN